MKITCTKREDIIKQREAYEAERAARQARYDEQERKYDEAEYAITSAVANELKSQLSKYSALQFDVEVDRNNWRLPGLRVRVLCNEHNKFDDDVALSWNYNVNLDESGSVNKESSSWSGLKATTEAQLESLTQTLDALKYLNSIDWATLLNKELPKYADYVTEIDPRYDSDVPNFDYMLMEADIEEAIGKDVLLKGRASIDDNTGRKRGEAYYLILKQTPMQYEICRIPGYAIESTDNLKELVEKNKKYSERISKAKFTKLLNNPIETLEV